MEATITEGGNISLRIFPPSEEKSNFYNEAIEQKLCGFFLEEDMPVQIIIDEKEGVGTPVLITPKRKSTIEAMAFYATLEPLIDRFKCDVRKTLSAYVDRSNRRNK